MKYGFWIFLGALPCLGFLPLLNDVSHRDAWVFTLLVFLGLTIAFLKADRRIASCRGKLSTPIYNDVYQRMLVPLLLSGLFVISLTMILSLCPAAVIAIPFVNAALVYSFWYCAHSQKAKAVLETCSGN